MTDVVQPTTFPESELMLKLVAEKKSAREFQERRHPEWNDNYELYRNKTKTNRLTQRQAIGVPLMKETVFTLLSKVDDPPIVDWKELAGDKSKEVILQEVWNDDFERNNFEAIDIQDKKTVLLYGRSFKKLNWINKKFDIRALDIFDVVIDPLVDPTNLETARFVIHQNIFRSLREILADKRYLEKAKEDLKAWLTSKEGIIQTSQNKEEWEKKLERLKAIGVEENDFPLFAGGDLIVNLTEHYTNIWNSEKKEFERRVVVYADDKVELLSETLEDLLGIDFYPFVSWGNDIETQDYWSDGPADLVRTPNKILNIWFSQLAENRTLRNFQMHWVDTSKGYAPQTFEPGPGRQIPAPPLGPNQSIRDVVMPVEISGLDETLTSIDFLIRLVERGTGATAIEKGVSEKKQITLGEVQLLVGKAMERIQSMAKFYRRSWEELAMKWYRLMEVNAKGSRKLYKISQDGRIWPKTAYPSDWKSEFGYKAIIRSTSEQEEENVKGIQKISFVKSLFPNNPALNKILQKRALEIIDLTPQELREVENSEEKIVSQLPTQTNPEEEQLAQTIQKQVGELINV